MMSGCLFDLGRRKPGCSELGKLEGCGTPGADSGCLFALERPDWPGSASELGELGRSGAPGQSPEEEALWDWKERGEHVVQGEEAPFISMRRNLSFWESVGASPFVLSVIDQGFRLEVDEEQLSRVYLAGSGNRSSTSLPSSAEFVTRTLLEWVSSGVAEPQSVSQYSFPLHVVDNGRKLRLIHDLSRLNSLLPRAKFKLEDMRVMWHFLPENGFMCTWDMRAGYHHIAIHPESRRFLGFEWSHEGVSLSGRAVGLPFGLSLAPFVFTKVFRPLIKRWRAMGINTCLYIDDGIIFGETEEQCREAVSQVQRDLAAAGVKIAPEKSMWEPSQSGEWLGFHIDLREKKVSISAERRAKALSRVRNCLAKRSPSVRDRQIVCGTVASCSLLTGDRGALHAKSLEEVIDFLLSQGKQHAPLSIREREELEFWENEFLAGPSRSFAQPVLAVPPSLVVETDASAVAAGALLKLNGEILAKVSQNFTDTERGESSAKRELRAVLLAWRAFAERLRGNSVEFRTDSQAAVRILQRGSMKLHLHEMALEAERASTELRVEPSYQWIPRENNGQADAVSREFDFDDWGIKDSVFNMLCKRWSEPSIDCFADERNTKCSLFFSKDASPGSTGVDFFCSASEGSLRQFLWCVPPPSFIGKFLVHAKKWHVKCILGIPMWESAPFFPKVRPKGEWERFVLDVVEYGRGAKILTPATDSSSVFGSETVQSGFAFLLCQF